MNKINKKYIIILGSLLVLLVIIVGVITYFQKEKVKILVKPKKEINELPSFEKVYTKDHPIIPEETVLFGQSCAGASTIIADQEQRFIPISCFLKPQSSQGEGNGYEILPVPLENINELPLGQYITMAIDFKGLLEEKDSIVSLDQSFNLCTIAKPILSEPFLEKLIEQYYQEEIDNIAIYPEGEVSCTKLFGLPNKHNHLLMSGTFLEEGLFQLKTYFVSDDNQVNQIFSQLSFKDIENLLQLHPLLLNIEKPIK